MMMVVSSLFSAVSNIVLLLFVDKALKTIKREKNELRTATIILSVLQTKQGKVKQVAVHEKDWSMQKHGRVFFMWQCLVRKEAVK